MKKLLVGQIFGNLLVLSDDFVDENHTKILVRCKCGKEFGVNKSNLMRGTTKSCGIGECNPARMNEVGSKYGYLLVLELAEPPGGYETSNSLHWKCKCDCGNFSIVRGTELRNGRIKSCGCKSRLLMSQKLNKGFGESNMHQLFTTYKGSARRRGIQFLLSEQEFRGFLFNNCLYCGRKPYGICTKDSLCSESGKQIIKYNGIDRVDNNQGYTLENCITCCKICNFAKRSMPHEEFTAWLDDVAVFRKPLLEKKEIHTESIL